MTLISNCFFLKPKPKPEVFEVKTRGTTKGNINSERIRIRSTADVDGVLNQKNLSIEDGARLKIKAETY